MDNKEFDKIIRDKVSDYKDTQIDSGALQDMHNRLDGVAVTPWYEPYGNIGKYAAGIALISLINFSMFWWWHQGHEKKLNDQIERLAGLQTIDKRLTDKDNNETSPTRIDTVYIMQKVPFTENPRPQANRITRKQDASNVNSVANRQVESGLFLLAIDQKDISKEAKQLLMQYQLATLGEDGKIYLHYQKQSLSLVQRKGYPNLVAYAGANYSIEPVENKTKNVLESKSQNQGLSVKLLRDIEKHSMHGVGLRWGPEIDLFNTQPGIGKGKIGVGAGAMGELVLSPTLRLETGVKYNYLAYKINGSIDENLLTAFPAIDNDINTLNEINVSIHALNIPLHIKYMYPLSRDRSLFTSLGLSSQYYAWQEFHYSYSYNLDVGNQEHFEAEIKASKREEPGKFYLSSVDMSIGMEKKMKNENYFVLAAFYNYGINKMGIEKNKLGMFGIRSSVRFKLN